MYQNSESYLAESTGLAIGRRQGYQDGYAAGHDAGWNACVKDWNAQIRDQWEPLVDRLTAERDAALQECEALRAELRQQGQQNRAWQAAFAALVVSLDAAMEALQEAPQGLRNRMIVALGKRVERANSGGGWLRSMPQDDPTLRKYARSTADKLRGWWDQALAQAKKSAERDSTPTP